MAKQSEGETREIQDIIRDVDDALRSRGIPIHVRPLHAMSEVCKRMGVQEATCFGPAPSVSAEHVGDSIASMVGQWYERTYGDRLKIHFGPGTIAILIRDDPWLVRFPLLYGEFLPACVPDPQSWKGLHDAAVLNVLDHIEGLTPGLRGTLSEAECADILRAFTHGFDALQALHRIGEKRFVHEAIGDQVSAVTCIFAEPPQYGASRWHSLQLVEKLLKCYIDSRGGKIPKRREGHELKYVAEKAQEVGLASLDTSLIEAVQCYAKVRYGDVATSLTDAVEAHWASLEICRQIVPQIESS